MLEKLNKYERSTLALAAILVAIVFFISLNIFSSQALRSSQIDLTEDGLYTLSPGTVAVLKSIDEPIIMRFYLSRQLTEQSPEYAQYAQRVRELLDRYANIAHGKLKLENYAPDPYSEESDRAMAAGLQGIPVDNAGAVGYFGLVATNSTDDIQVIPFFSPDREQFLEYDLTKMIYSLAHPKKRTIGLYTSLPLKADPSNDYQPWPIYRELAQFFNVRSLRGEGRVPDDIDVLLVAFPRNMTDAEIYAIDQFVLRGGRALVLVDPYFESGKYDFSKGPPARSVTTSDLPKLFKAWGVKFSTDKVVGDRTVAQSVNATSADGRTIVTDYLPWLSLRAPNFAKNDIATAQMSRINMASAGFFTLTPGATTKMKPLIVSSPQSEQINVSDVNFIPDPAGLLGHFKSEDRVFPLAVRLTGPVKSIYPDGPPWDPIKKPGQTASDKSAQSAAADSKSNDDAKSGSGAVNGGKPKYLTQSVKPINVVLVGDADILASRFWMQEQNVYGRHVAVPIANNAEFIINVLDNLSGSDELISLRTRGLSYRPFVVVQRIQHNAEAKYRETEQEISRRLKETQAKLQELRGGETGSGTTVLTEQQKQAIETFRAQVLSLRRQLRDVQHDLRKDIDSLDTELKILNIWAMPVIISILALILLVVRQARRRRRMPHA